MSHPQQLLAQWLEQNQMTIEADESYRISVAEANLRQRAAARLAYARFLIHHNEPTRAKPLLKMPITADEGVHAEAQEADRLFLQAVIARLESRFAEAQATLSKLHQERRDSVAVSNHLAAILVEHEDEGVRGRALQITESMVRNTPKSADAWATLGWVQLRLGDVIAAEASLGQSLKLGNPSRDTLHYLAQMKRLSGRTDEAESLDRLYESAKGPKFFLTPKAAN
jgi:tetratricopeptide (TPR) repeat protein